MVSTFLLLLAVPLIFLGSFRACQLIYRWILLCRLVTGPDPLAALKGAKPKDDCAFGIKVRFNDIALSYGFRDRKASEDFIVGFREGQEQLLMYYQRAGVVSPDAYIDHTGVPPHE